MKLGYKVAQASARMFSSSARNARSASVAKLLGPNARSVNAAATSLRKDQAVGQSRLANLNLLALLVDAGLTRKQAKNVIDATEHGSVQPSLSAMGLSSQQAVSVFNRLAANTMPPSAQAQMSKAPSQWLFRGMEKAAGAGSTDLVAAKDSVVLKLKSFSVKSKEDTGLLLKIVGGGIVGQFSVANGQVVVRPQSPRHMLFEQAPDRARELVAHNAAVVAGKASVAMSVATQQLRNGVTTAKLNTFNAAVRTANGAARAVGATYAHAIVPVGVASAFAIAAPTAIGLGAALGAPVLAVGAVGSMLGAAAFVVRDGVVGNGGVSQRAEQARSALASRFGWNQ